jgi:hypothetical protein
MINRQHDVLATQAPANRIEEVIATLRQELAAAPGGGRRLRQAIALLHSAVDALDPFRPIVADVAEPDRRDHG